MVLNFNEVYTKIVSLKHECNLIDKEIYSLKLLKENIDKDIVDIESKILDKNNKVLIYTDSVLFLQRLEELIKKMTFSRIEVMVTEALQEIYTNSKLLFKITSATKKNGLLDIKFNLENSSLNKSFNIMRGFGGGIKDIISTILRIIFSELLRVKGPIVLDEVGKHISNEYQNLFGKFLRYLSRSLNRQLILISHEDTIITTADKVLKLSLQGNSTIVQEAG